MDSNIVSCVNQNPNISQNTSSSQINFSNDRGDAKYLKRLKQSSDRERAKTIVYRQYEQWIKYPEFLYIIDTLKDDKFRKQLEMFIYQYRLANYQSEEQMLQNTFTNCLKQ